MLGFIALMICYRAINYYNDGDPDRALFLLGVAVVVTLIGISWKSAPSTLRLENKDK
jgi:hypothetical protein